MNNARAEAIEAAESSCEFLDAITRDYFQYYFCEKSKNCPYFHQYIDHSDPTSYCSPEMIYAQDLRDFEGGGWFDCYVTCNAPISCTLTYECLKTQHG